MHDYLFLNNHPMPAHWHWLLPNSILDNLKLPVEPKANCSQCPSKLNGYTHKAHCCTYRPQIANFLTGLALSEGILPSGKLNTLVKKGVFTPLAIFETPEATQQQERLREQAPETLPTCHFWKEGVGCGVHKFRNHVCSTFFCFTTAGHENGLWMALADYVMMLENNISWWLLDNLGYDLSDMYLKIEKNDELVGDSLSWSEDLLKSIWGPWFGNEKEFFEKCSSLVLENKEDLYDIALNYLDNARNDFKNTINEIPGRLDTTHLPFYSNEIKQAEKELIVENDELQHAKPTNITSLELSPFAVLQSPEEMEDLKEGFPDAYGFIVLALQEDEGVDFQPLTKPQWDAVKSLALGEKMSSDISEDDLTVLAGLRLRGFFRS